MSSALKGMSLGKQQKQKYIKLTLMLYHLPEQIVIPLKDY